MHCDSCLDLRISLVLRRTTLQKLYLDVHCTPFCGACAETTRFSNILGRVIAPSHKPQWDWAWDPQLAPKNIEVAYGNRVARRLKDQQEVDVKDLIVVCKRPIRLFTHETSEFHVEVVETTGAWGGLQIGVVPDCQVGGSRSAGGPFLRQFLRMLCKLILNVVLVNYIT